MKKYWAIFQVSWQRNLQYRFGFYVQLLRHVLILLVLILIWRAVFNQVDDFGGYTFSTMLTYLVMIRFINFTERSVTARMIADEVKDGELSKYLLKPVKYLRFWFCRFWADRLFEALVRVSMVVVFWLIAPNLFQLASPRRALMFVISLPLALVLNYFFNILLASFSFWVTDIRLFSTFVGLTAGFLAGELVPLDLLPGILKKAALILPFQFALYFPVKIFQGSLSSREILRGGVIYLVWLGVFYWLSISRWKKGLKKYEAIGH